MGPVERPVLPTSPIVSFILNNHLFYIYLVHMRIPGLKTVAVIDDDFVAVAFVAVLGFDYPPLAIT